MKAVLFAVLLCALVALTLGRESNVDTLQDILSTLQESQSAQTLDADVEAYKKVSGGLVDKVKEMKTKLNAQHKENRDTYNAGVAKRRKEKAEAEKAKKDAEADEDRVQADAKKTRAAQNKLWNKVKEENKAVQESVAGIIKYAGLFSGHQAQVKAIIAAANKAKSDQKEKSDRVKSAYDKEMARVKKEEDDAAKAVRKTLNFLRKLLREQKKDAKAARETYNHNRRAINNEVQLCNQILALVSNKSGWVKLGRISTGNHYNHLIKSFNDQGMKYSKIRLTNRGSYTDWARGHHKVWTSHGFDIGKNAIKLDGHWYHSSYAPHKCGSKKYHTLDKKYFKIVQRNNYCYWGHHNKPACANVVEIDTRGKRFQGISDIETIGNCWKGDNKFKYQFDVEVYVH